MRVVEDASAKSIGDFLDRLGCGPETEEGRELQDAIRTDGWKSYAKAVIRRTHRACRRSTCNRT